MRNWIPLKPAMEVETTRGFGHAHFILDQGEERDLQYYCCIHEGEAAGQFWIVPNQEVRAVRNWTLFRKHGDMLKRRP